MLAFHGSMVHPIATCIDTAIKLEEAPDMGASLTKVWLKETMISVISILRGFILGLSSNEIQLS